MVTIKRKSDGTCMLLHVSEVIAIVQENGFGGTITEVHSPSYYQVKLGRSDFMTDLNEEQIHKLP
jgi:hypothetical protein